MTAQSLQSPRPGRPCRRRGPFHLRRPLHIEELETRLTPSAGRVFVVNSVRDAAAAHLTDGTAWTGAFTATGAKEVTLRSALMEANVDPGADTVVLPGGTYKLDPAAGGAINIFDSVTVIGADDGTPTIIDLHGFGSGAFFITAPPTAVVNFSRLTITAGTTPGDGGAILNLGASLSLDQVTLLDNSADRRGGALANETGPDAFLRITDSLFVGNRGGLYNTGPGVVVNSTFANNDLAPTGGGIDNYSDDQRLFLVNDTFSGNRVHIVVTSGTVVLANSILGPTSGGPAVVGSGLVSTGHNIDATGTAGLTGDGDVVADPLLGPLGDNGGPTKTFALLAGSPAIDAADPRFNVGYDQRDNPRPLGAGSDIGAYEAGAVVLDVNSAAPEKTYFPTQALDIAVRFSEPVFVDTAHGTPILQLSNGGTASYISGSGTNVLTFHYTVQFGDGSGRLDEAGATALDVNGGTIDDSGGMAATTALPAAGAPNSLGANKDLEINGNPAPPAISLTVSPFTFPGLPRFVNWQVTDVAGLQSVTATVTKRGDPTFRQVFHTVSGALTFSASNPGDFTVEVDAASVDSLTNSATIDFAVDSGGGVIALPPGGRPPPGVPPGAGTPDVKVGGSAGTESTRQTHSFFWSVSGFGLSPFIDVEIAGTNTGTLQQSVDPNGVFNFSNVPPGVYTITVTAASNPGAPDTQRKSQSVTVIDAQQLAARVTLSGSGGIENDAQTQAYTWAVSDLENAATSVIVLTRDGQVVRTATGNTGTINFDDLGPGDYRVTVTSTAPGYVPLSSSSGNSSSIFGVPPLVTTATAYVTVVDDDVTGPTIVLTGSQGTEDDTQPHHFGWRVDDSSGVGPVAVAVFRAGRQVFTSTAAQGNFDFTGAPDGNYEIRVAAVDADGDWTGDALPFAATRRVIVTAAPPPPISTGGPGVRPPAPPPPPPPPPPPLPQPVIQVQVVPQVDLGGSQGVQAAGAHFFTWTVQNTPGLQEVDVEVLHNGRVVATSHERKGVFDFDGAGPGSYEIVVRAVGAGGATTVVAFRAATVPAITDLPEFVLLTSDPPVVEFFTDVSFSVSETRQVTTEEFVSPIFEETFFDPGPGGTVEHPEPVLVVVVDLDELPPLPLTLADQRPLRLGASVVDADDTATLPDLLRRRQQGSAPLIVPVAQLVPGDHEAGHFVRPRLPDPEGSPVVIVSHQPPPGPVAPSGADTQQHSRHIVVPETQIADREVTSTAVVLEPAPGWTVQALRWAWAPAAVVLGAIGWRWHRRRGLRVRIPRGEATHPPLD